MFTFRKRHWLLKWTDNFRKNGSIKTFSLFVLLIQLLSCVQLSATPWTAACQAPLSFTVPRSCSDSCPLSWWCSLTISFSAASFSSCLQSFPASGSFPMSLFASGGQSIGASVFSISPSNDYSSRFSFQIAPKQWEQETFKPYSLKRADFCNSQCKKVGSGWRRRK